MANVGMAVLLPGRKKTKYKISILLLWLPCALWAESVRCNILASSETLGFVVDEVLQQSEVSALQVHFKSKIVKKNMFL